MTALIALLNRPHEVGKRRLTPGEWKSSLASASDRHRKERPWPSLFVTGSAEFDRFYYQAIQNSAFAKYAELPVTEARRRERRGRRARRARQWRPEGAAP